MPVKTIPTMFFFTSGYDVSHAMGFRVWGRNSIKNRLLTLLDINLCIKSGIAHFFSPSPTIYLFKVTVYLYLGGGTKARILLGQIQNGVLSLEA